MQGAPQIKVSNKAGGRANCLELEAMFYSNPVWPGYCADPFVLRHDDFYYAYGTGPRDEAGREFVVLRSPDLNNWEQLDNALEPVPAFARKPHWAPEVAFAGGRFWMYYSADAKAGDVGHHLRVAVADEPGGPFRDCGKELLPDQGFSIDASPFCDPVSGQWYLFYARDYFDQRVGTGTAMVPLADDMMTVLDAPRAVVRASNDWQIYERDRHHYGQFFNSWHTVEGPFVVWREGKYYLLYSGGKWESSGYGVSYAIADSPLGPWTDFGDRPHVLQGTPDVIGPGHCSVVLGPDDETLVCCYHAWNRERTKRQLCVDPIAWTSDGPRVTPTRGKAEGQRI